MPSQASSMLMNNYTAEIYCLCRTRALPARAGLAANLCCAGGLLRRCFCSPCGWVAALDSDWRRAGDEHGQQWRCIFLN